MLLNQKLIFLEILEIILVHLFTNLLPFPTHIVIGSRVVSWAGMGKSQVSPNLIKMQQPSRYLAQAKPNPTHSVM